VVVLAKLVSYGGGRPPIAEVAGDLALSPSQVHASLKRLERSRLIDAQTGRPLLKAVEDCGEWRPPARMAGCGRQGTRRYARTTTQGRPEGRPEGPTDATVLGFSNRWYPAAIETAQTFHIAGHDVRVVTPALFIATKLEAFHGRGGDDVVASHDLEDIIAVVDGRPEIVGDVAAASDGVRAYVGAEIRTLFDNRDFTEALAGFLLPDRASQARRSFLEDRLRSL
jgi:DNA-binding Lrp family transcriptional regulator